MELCFFKIMIAPDEMTRYKLFVLVALVFLANQGTFKNKS